MLSRLSASLGTAIGLLPLPPTAPQPFPLLVRCFNNSKTALRIAFIFFCGFERKNSATFSLNVSAVVVVASHGDCCAGCSSNRLNPNNNNNNNMKMFIYRAPCLANSGRVALTYMMSHENSSVDIRCILSIHSSSFNHSFCFSLPLPLSLPLSRSHTKVKETEITE